MFIHFGKEFFGTSYPKGYRTPKVLRNVALNDHKAHAIGVFPLLISFPLLRGTRVRKIGRSIHS